MATVNGLHLHNIEDADAVAGAELEGSPEAEARERRERAVNLLHRTLGRYGSRELLLTAYQQYSVPWSDWLCAGAAQSGDPDKL
jgi:hypothetical protein